MGYQASTCHSFHCQKQMSINWKKSAKRLIVGEMRKLSVKNIFSMKSSVDIDFIATQIAQKQNVKKAEKCKEKEYKQTIESFLDKLAVLDEQRQNFKKTKAFEIGLHQKKSKIEERDTWFLNNPSLIGQDQPPRINDFQYIPSCSLQKFDGEDLGKMQRIKMQQKEIGIWSEQIIKKKNEKKQNETKEIAQYVERRDDYLNYLDNVQKQKNECKQLDRMQIANSNIVQKQENKNKKMKNKAMESKESESEILRMSKSTFLNESWSSTLRNDEKHRFIPYNFKGFSQNQRQTFLNKQSEQIQQNLDNAMSEKMKNEEFNQEQQGYSRSMLLKLRNAQRFKEEQKKKLAQIHIAQIEETKNKKNETNKLYQNAATPAYFQQFQTSTR